MNQINSMEKLPSVKVISILSSILWYLGIVALVLLVLISSALFIFDQNVKYINLPISVTYENSDTPPFEELNYYNDYPIVGFTQVKIDIDNEGGFNYNLIIPLLLIIGYLWIMKQIRLFVKTIKSGNPFVRENPKRIRLIGFVVMVTGPIMGGLQYLYTLPYYYLLDFPGAEIEIEPNIYPVAIFLGLVIFIIGHVYDLGVKLKEDNDLTI